MQSTHTVIYIRRNPAALLRLPSIPILMTRLSLSVTRSTLVSPDYLFADFVFSLFPLLSLLCSFFAALFLVSFLSEEKSVGDEESTDYRLESKMKAGAGPSAGAHTQKEHRQAGIVSMLCLSVCLLEREITSYR